MFENAPGDLHAEIRDTIENHLTKLKEWLDVRLQKQEDLLRCLRDSRKLPASQSQVSLEEVVAPTDSICAHTETPPVLLGGRQVSERTGSNNDLETFYDSANSSNDLEEYQDGHLRRTASAEQGIANGFLEELPPLPGYTGFDSSLPKSLTNASSLTKATTNALPKLQADTNGSRKACKEAEKLCITDLLDNEWHSKLMDVFDQLDLDRSGSIDRSEFREAFEEVGMPTMEAFDVFKSMDKTDNGVIDRMEWLHIIEDASRGSEAEVDLLQKFLDKLAKRQRTRGQIYDTDRTRSPCLILRHDSMYRMSWDLLMMTLLFYVAVSMPYSLGFGGSETMDKIDRVFDMFFCCDVLLNFRTSYLDRDETIVVNGCQIATKYLKSWFVLDFVSSVPFDLITAGLMPNLTPARLLKVGKIAKVMKLLRISKILSVLAESELMEKVDEKSTSRMHQTVVRITRLISLAFIIAHWLACFGAAVDTSSLEVYFANEDTEASATQQYLAAMYWAMTTLSTVGYGDIVPQTDAERAYAMIAMVIGGALYGYVIGSVTSIVTDMDLNARAFHDRMELVQSWLDRHNEVPKLLRRRLRKHFKRTLAAKAAMDDSTVVTDLSPELRADTAFYLINQHVRQHPMFSHVANSGLAKLVEVLQKNHSTKNEYIVKVGDPGIAMYVLVEGSARYDAGLPWHPEDVANPCQRFQPVVEGNSFGEEILFGLEENYLYSIVTLSQCEFHSISEDSYQEKFLHMPELCALMKAAFLRSKGSHQPECDFTPRMSVHVKEKETSSILNSYEPPQTKAPFSPIPYRSRIKMPRQFRLHTH